MIGRHLGQWQLQHPVGRGAMGTVYRATGDDGRAAAVKVLAPELCRDELFVSRFQREIEVLQQLSHEHIVGYFGSGREDGLLYLAMEYVDGPNYEQRIQDRGKLPWSEALTVGRQVTLALKHAHDRGIIHRDLKPANILCAGNPDGPDGPFVKLTDFGVAKLFASAPLTAAGAFVGTAAYLAPEQSAGKPPSKRGDMYSLGCVLYAMVIGRPPFTGETTTELIHQHRFALPEQPIRLLPDLPHDVNALILALLEKDPAKRPADGSVLLRVIDRIRGKLDRRGATPVDTIVDPDTDRSSRRPTELSGNGEMPVPEGPGPATFAAAFVREELLRQNRGGPVARFFNHPLVLILLLALCVGGIIWGIWRPRPSPEQLIAAAQPLMDSDDPADWQRAWNEYIVPLNEHYFDHPYKDQVAALRRRIEDQADRDRVLGRAKKARNVSEAERFYRQGLHLCDVGDAAGAQRVWQGVIASFGEVASEARWVQQARDGLKDLASLRLRDRTDVEAALAEARRLKAAGKRAEAEAIWNGLESLYKNDAAGAEVLAAINRDRS